MPCNQCQPNMNVFGESFARREVKRYRKNGPDENTRILLDALKAEGVEGQTLLDIGGGIGAIQLELLRAGVTDATDVDASPDYITAARAEAQRAGVTGRVHYLSGDFVALAPELAPAGVVTLDRVVCCYADMRRLVGESSQRATKLYGLVYPRDTPLLRAASRVMSALTALFRASFRFYVHPSADVDAIVRANGLAPRFHRHGFFWQVAVYARPNADAA